MRVHLHLDWENEELRAARANSKDELLDFCKSLVLGTDKFDEINREYFHLLPGRLPKQKAAKNTAKIIEKEGERFHILEEMPDDSEAERETEQDPQGIE
jgi:hypothetical protein